LIDRRHSCKIGETEEESPVDEAEVVGDHLDACFEADQGSIFTEIHDLSYQGWVATKMGFGKHGSPLG